MASLLATVCTAEASVFTSPNNFVEIPVESLYRINRNVVMLSRFSIRSSEVQLAGQTVLWGERTSFNIMRFVPARPRKPHGRLAITNPTARANSVSRRKPLLARQATVFNESVPPGTQ
jgi:hypothetical protein